MKILLTGASGKLGRKVAPLFPDALTPSSKELNVTDAAAVDAYIKKNKPDIVIHLAAMTAPPRCEENKRIAWDVNVAGTAHLIDVCLKYNPKCYFVLMSTPCVFSGDDETPKDENYVQYPDNFYGVTKMLQELVVARSKLKYLIIRANFVPYEKWPYPNAFVDRKSNYLFAHQLAKGIKEVVDVYLEGVVHILGDEILSMYDLAKLCPDSGNVGTMSYSDYDSSKNKVKLTKNMVLKSTRWKLYSIREGV